MPTKSLTKKVRTLNSRNHPLSGNEKQINVLEKSVGNIPHFKDKLKETGIDPLKPTGIEILQVNVGKMCNQTCKHCHVDAGPDRKEIMTRETMEQCLKAIEGTDIDTVDITGGAPEMNPNFRWFVEKISDMDKKIMVRCNLTIIVANKNYYDLPEFYKKHKVEVISSLPYFSARRTDAQRGEGVFEKSIRALKMLNKVGYGKNNDDLELNLVYNPTGAFLPGDQDGLEKEFKKKLFEGYGIVFNNLFTITNLPISRFLDYLLISGNFDSYMESLSNAYNPEAAREVMCRNTISVGWDGAIYDCDFNQMLDLKVRDKANHISNFDLKKLNNREIIVSQHCYGCTAGAGSSCGGATT